MKHILLLGLFCSLLAGQEYDVALERIDLSKVLGLDGKQRSAHLYIPTNPDSQTTELWIHFHGESWVVEKAWRKIGQPRPLVVINYGSLSSAYEQPMQTAGGFEKVLAASAKALAGQGITLDPVRLDLWMTSFSAGYGALRELLKDEAVYRRISLMMLSDGLYAGLKPEEIMVQMKDFVRFAGDAMREEKTLIITHTTINPRGYSGSQATANYILDAVELERKPAWGKDVIGLAESEAISGNLIILGYHGKTPEEHIKHFHGMWHPLLLGRTVGLSE